MRFFQSLDRFVQHEPWLERDRAMIDMLKSIGIEKGKPFDPDPNTQAILKEAIGEAHAWLDNRYETVIFSTSFNEGKHWALPASPEVGEGMMTNFRRPNAYPVEGRGLTYSMAFFSAKHLGAGQYYLMTIKDKDGKPLDGGGTYRLNVPANAPVKLYWSATVYDRATHALIRDRNRSSRSSQTPGPAKERRRFGRRVFRAEGSGRQGIELGADERERQIRGAVSSLRAREAVLRQDVDAAGYREGRRAMSQWERQ